VKHSLSPAMQTAAFKALRIDAEYLVYDVEPVHLTEFLDNLLHSRSGISGLNVTIPHKIEVKKYLERKGSSFDRLRTNPGLLPKGSLDEIAKRLGAVNTIKVTAGGLQGYNTDGAGFYRSLVEDLKFEPEGRTVLVLGAGGAASAIVMYLGTGPQRIYVFDVDKDKVEDLKSRYGKYYDNKRFVAVKDPALRDEALEGTDLLINATPLGMRESDPSPVDSSFLHAGMHVYDLVYNRPATKLVKEAARAKCHAVTGLGMLLYQGAISFEIWTGLKAPIDTMRKALRDALREKDATRNS
jgi:shikimate dehydrogenase